VKQLPIPGIAAILPFPPGIVAAGLAISFGVAALLVNPLIRLKHTPKLWVKRLAFWSAIGAVAVGVYLLTVVGGATALPQTLPLPWTERIIPLSLPIVIGVSYALAVCSSDSGGFPYPDGGCSSIAFLAGGDLVRYVCTDFSVAVP
jgi:hypothetical protein